MKYRILTFFSKNHFDEALTSCQSLHSLPETKNWKYGTMVAYIHTDIPSRLLFKYSRLCPIVEIRRYNYSNLPKHIYKRLSTCAWKPIMLQKFMKESNQFLYIDASIVFQMEANDTIKSLFDSMNEFPCGIRDLQSVSHSVFSATHPQMLEYLNFREEQAKNSEMVAGGLFVFSKTKQSQQIVDEWADCAMTDGCISPPGSQLYCDGNKLKNKEYANCHRFDQSALNILLYKCNPQIDKIFRETDLIKVCRDGC